MTCFVVYHKPFKFPKALAITVHTSMLGLEATLRGKRYATNLPCLAVVKDSSELTREEQDLALDRLKGKFYDRCRPSLWCNELKTARMRRCAVGRPGTDNFGAPHKFGARIIQCLQLKLTFK